LEDFGVEIIRIEYRCYKHYGRTGKNSVANVKNCIGMRLKLPALLFLKSKEIPRKFGFHGYQGFIYGLWAGAP